MLFGRCNLKDNEKNFAEVNKLKDSLLKKKKKKNKQNKQTKNILLSYEKNK